MTAIRRVFLSHTSEFTKFPEKKSFIDAAIAAINRAGMVPCDMGYFTARDEKPAKYCEDNVRACDLYVGIIGSRYGSPVRDRPDISYTELEFESASKSPALKRLVFLLDENALVPLGLFNDQQYGDRQATFRKRIGDAGVMCKAFGDVHELEKLVYQALIEEVTGTDGTTNKDMRLDWPDGVSPYPGLSWFNEDYAELFFGRNRAVDAVIGRLGEPACRLVIVSGDSGLGKSSLIGAGVWRALIKDGRIPGSKNWLWLRIRPGDSKSTPFEPLAWGLKVKLPRIAQNPEKLAADLAAGPSCLGALLGEQLSGDRELLLFIDQMEELFTRGFAAADINNFLDQLVATTRDKNLRLRVIASLRSEFIGRLEESDSVRALLNAGHNYHVDRVSEKDLEEMIVKPAQATGYDFEDKLVNDILADAKNEPGCLPLVAYALKQLFERRRDRTFTRDAYKEIEGIAGAIGKQADQIIGGLDAEAIAAFDRVFAELVYIGRDRPPTRRRCPRVVFKTDSGAEKLIDALTSADCRIMVTGGDGRDATVEVAHEKLFTAWPRLKEWIDNAGEALRLIEHATEAAQRWHKGGEAPQNLWPAKGAFEVLNALKRFGKKASIDLESFLRPQQVLIQQLERNALSHKERELIGEKLAEFDDPRCGVGRRSDGLPDIEWMDIPAGTVTIEGVEPAMDVKAFRIAKYPVTNMQFKAFVEAADGYENKEWWKGIKRSEASRKPSWQDDNRPRETVTWYEAVAFCRWVSARLSLKIRLPTEWEWQQAETGGDAKREYPWEGGWDTARCNSRESRLNRTTAVGVYPNGATQQGVLDMVGNVSEWCLNKYEQADKEEALRIDDSVGARVLRGGSWLHGPEHLRSSFRLRGNAGNGNDLVGFRLAQDLN